MADASGPRTRTVTHSIPCDRECLVNNYTRFVLPTFLGIGAPRAGTTWISDLLGSHPDVAMSKDRKEVHFFDLHFDRGLTWYQRFFPSLDVAPAAVGEYSPHYMYDSAVPHRVSSVNTIDRFIVSVRHPVERAISHYRFRQLADGYRGSFDDFLVAYPDATGWGYYARHLAPWFDHFDHDRFLVLVFEHAVSDVESTKRALAGHLSIDVAKFPDSSGAEPRNDSYVPSHPRLQRAARRGARRLRSIDADWAIRLARRTGAAEMVKRRTPGSVAEAVTDRTRARLGELYQADIERLEALTGLSLDLWHTPGPTADRAAPRQ